MISIYSATSVSGTLREVGVFNTTDTAVAVRLVRLTTQGTPGAGLTRAEHRPDGVASSCTPFNTHSGDATVGDDLGYRATLGAAKGAGAIWTFGDTGIVIPTGTANGIGVILENGTGQALQAYLVWDE
jgi:hypothetical protein